MNIHLTSHSEELLKEQLAHGSYQPPEEVIERALENLACASVPDAQRRSPRKLSHTFGNPAKA